MCLRFVFLLITRTVTSLRLSRREEAWRIAEILILPGPWRRGAGEAVTAPLAPRTPHGVLRESPRQAPAPDPTRHPRRNTSFTSSCTRSIVRPRSRAPGSAGSRIVTGVPTARRTRLVRISWGASIPLGRHPVRLLHIGLYLCVSTLAPCSLGCPGTPRHHAAPAARREAWRPHKMAGSGLSGTVRQQIKENKRTKQGTLNPRVRGSSPWRRTRSDLGFHHSRLFLCVRFVPMLAPCLLVS